MLEVLRACIVLSWVVVVGERYSEPVLCRAGWLM